MVGVGVKMIGLLDWIYLTDYLILKLGTSKRSIFVKYNLCTLDKLL